MEWSQSLLSPVDALDSLIALLGTNRVGFIKRIKNSEARVPIYKNINDFSIWEYEAVWTDKPVFPAFGTVEYDLYTNYLPMYSLQKATTIYIETGKVTKGLFSGVGQQTPVKIEDVIKHHNPQAKRSPNYKWSVNNRLVPDPKIKYVYVVEMTDETVHDNIDKLKLIERVLQTIKKYETTK